MVLSKDHCQVHVPERFSELQHTGHPNCKHIVEGTSFVSFLVALEVAFWKVVKEWMQQTCCWTLRTC